MIRPPAPVDSERGAVAVVVGIMATVLFVFAALAVDLGNGFARRTVVQSQADHAALAGGQKLTATVTASGTPSAAVVDEVRDYLNLNYPQTDDDDCWRNSPVDCVTSADLTNGQLDDGEAQHTVTGLRVVAPAAFVNFAFAGAVDSDLDGVNVSADATVNVYTGGQVVLPMYGMEGCDWGPQTLGSPPGGHLPSTVPSTMQYPDDTNATTLVTAANAPPTPASPTVTTSAGQVVSEIPYNGSGYKVHFRAKRFEKTTTIGFFNADGQLVTSTAFYAGTTASGTALSTPYSAPNNNTEDTYSLVIPPAVTATPGIWYIRVYNDGNGSNKGWSARTQALPVSVGSAPVPCDGSSSAGNFGILDFPRSTPTPKADQAAANVILGVQPPLSPGRHFEADDGICAAGDPGVVISTDDDRKPGTNCVDTVTGDISQMATAGFVTGLTVSGTAHKGWLDSTQAGRSTHAGCAPDNTAANRSILSHTINNDTLSCFLTDATTNLGSLASPTYSGGPKFTTDIYSSPRLVYIPIFKVRPSSGGSQKYSIVDFRPGFITDETNSATRDGAFTGSADGSNGIILHSNKVEQVKIFFFHRDALPRDGDFPVIQYLGTGSPILRMVD